VRCLFEGNPTLKIWRDWGKIARKSYSIAVLSLVSKLC